MRSVRYFEKLALIKQKRITLIEASTLHPADEYDMIPARICVLHRAFKGGNGVVNNWGTAKSLTDRDTVE